MTSDRNEAADLPRETVDRKKVHLRATDNAATLVRLLVDLDLDLDRAPALLTQSASSNMRCSLMPMAMEC